MRITRVILAVAMLAAAWGCSDKSTPSSPSPSTPGTSTPPTLTKPAPDSPENGAQLDTKRPTLTVTNGTSSQTTAAKTYEFQVSDNSTFTASASFNVWFATTVSGTGVAEGSGGKTS